MSDPEQSGIARRRHHALVENSADYAAKRADLVRAAADVFRRKGYAGATLNDIAVAFGTDRASLYYYVASKAELFQECITGPVVANLARAEEIVRRPLSTRAKLEALIAMLIESQVEHYPYAYLYMENMHRADAVDDKWAQDMADRTRRLERFFLDVIAEGIADGSFRQDLSTTLIANSLFGMTQWIYRWYVPDRSHYSADDLIRVFCEVILGGIDNRHGGDTSSRRPHRDETSRAG